MPPTPASPGRSLLKVALLAVLVACAWYAQSGDGGVPPPRVAERTTEKPKARPADDGGAARIQELFASATSDIVVDVYGKVERVLRDDNEGSRHQKFILALRDGHTVLVAHNIDLAERVPLRAGDEVHVKGEFEYQEQGGVIHWTHRDPQGRHESGFIEHGGKRYH